ncbi:MAG TPA: hypothetical protein ENN97_03955 [Phycisphaerales bacterium]|nr:hypothetical protein [Phycisphaerales bacterium]
MKLPKFSMGIGDRFGCQGVAQLKAMRLAQAEGIDVTPVWNKSYREHSIIGTQPTDVRRQADAAVAALQWDRPYFVDADHVHLKTIDGFLECSDFFTLDVAEAIEQAAPDDDIEAFCRRNERFIGTLEIPGLDAPFTVTRQDIKRIADKFLFAVKEAGRIYRRILEQRPADAFVTEVSMDETDIPQSPAEMFFILSAIAAEGIPAQTIAPRFSGRFNKGVDYVGDPAQFEAEFRADIAVIAHAVKTFGLPDNLKLSVHSGSDKFSIYPAIRRAMRDFNAGVHLKTAGTTWLEELIGLALADAEGLDLAKAIYAESLAHFDDLCAPYAAVIDIDKTRLPSEQTVADWDGQRFAAALRHDPTCDDYNPDFRQLIHVGYKIAAQMGTRYTDRLTRFAEQIGPHVTDNIYRRHILPVFGAA